MNPGVHAAVTAANKKKEEQEEEERLTHYSMSELNDGWEFKIVRSEMKRFRKPDNFQRLLNEESVFGWRLVEKIDNQRVRFKRLPDDRKNDAIFSHDADPYRTNFDPSANLSGFIVAGAVIIIGVIIYLVIGLS